ncbi:hypothetical protein FN846DRAFT_285391 [Sphaerosporella brunnea]|uniref:CFEM domain-containing protein n=1 Tax=Sphaerosporella brunnea TaxID=1250544 RepID=A0A5J5EN49_9PEZI|nr:hypothetical protein FN846DRAFT_285391 [Sphaerosporella brunnea]
MKFTAIFVAAALAAVVSAQGLSAFPSCGAACLVGAVGSTSCDPTDLKCLCSSQLFISSSNNCLQQSCTPADLQSAQDALESSCNSVNVDIQPAV